MTAPVSTDQSRFSNVSAAGVMLVGVSLAIAAQICPGVPLAGAVALIAWGTASMVLHRPSLLLAAALVYAPLGVITVMAQVDLAMRTQNVVWAVVAGLDAALAITLLATIAR